MGEPGRAVRLTLAYEGTDLHGWQIQPGRDTVQGLVMGAAARVLGEPVRVTGASRTDAGVHALRQVASLSTSSPMAPAALQRALNALLPPAVRVVEAAEAPAGFDARRWARGKRYAYLIDRSAPADPFRRRYAWHVPFPLDAGAMAAAARALRGKHDFSAFCAAAGRDRTPVCTIRSVRVVTRRRLLAVCVAGDSFLHHMVRNIVGTLIYVGKGKHPPQWVDQVLASKNRAQAAPTFGPEGLYLERIEYEPKWGLPV
jgi:tRNA pseudouridine38-40 synthase